MKLPGTDQHHKNDKAILNFHIRDKQNEVESWHKLFCAKYNCKPHREDFWWRLEFWETGLRTEFWYSIFLKRTNNHALIKTQWKNHKTPFISGASFYIFRHQGGIYPRERKARWWGLLVPFYHETSCGSTLLCLWKRSAVLLFCTLLYDAVRSSEYTVSNDELKRIWTTAMVVHLRYLTHCVFSLQVYSLFQRDLVLLSIKVQYLLFTLESICLRLLPLLLVPSIFPFNNVLYKAIHKQYVTSPVSLPSFYYIYFQLVSPSTGLRGLERPRRLRLPGFYTLGTWRWWGRHPYAPAAFTPRNNILVLIFRGWIDLSDASEKIPSDQTGDR